MDQRFAILKRVFKLSTVRDTHYDDKDDLLAREIIQENTGEKDPELSLAGDFLEDLDLRLKQVKEIL